MILYEYEGKKLLQKAGIKIPRSQLISALDQQLTLQAPLVLKAQVLSGKRADAGGIVVCDEVTIYQSSISNLLGETINNETVDQVLVEERINFDQEYYLSLFYDTDTRGVVLTVSSVGGTGVEERKTKTYPLNILKPEFPQLEVPAEILERLWRLFLNADLLLLEVNPLVRVKGSPLTSLRTVASGDWVALDAKIKLDDSAVGRHQDWPNSWQRPRSAPGYTPTEREIEAKRIDEGDYRGVAGSTYFDLDGDIAILASGGGASLTALDALLKVGGRPANYTEYGGNPPKGKVERLTQIVLSKPNLHALWVVGAVANFTDVYETLSGFLGALRKVSPDPRLPIVIRRGGPRDQEAFAMLKEVKDFSLHLYGPETTITKSAEIVTQLAKEYAA